MSDLHRTVSEVMDREPAVVDESATAEQALCQLWAGYADEIYVTDEQGRLLGSLPDYELLKAVVNGTSGQSRAGALMSRSLATITQDCCIEQIAPLFRDGRCRQLPVVDGGRLVGSLSRRSVLGYLAGLQSHDPLTGPPHAASPPRIISGLHRRAALEPQVAG